MEDIPIYVKTEIEQFAKNRNFERILIVDCHNAMGEEISEPDSEDMLKAAKSALDTLITKEKYPLEFGYGNSDHMNLSSPDLGLGGVGVLCLKINGTKYFLGWADSNNMENGVREHIVNYFATNNLNLLEICTSDTHYSATKVRTRQGYYQFGKIAKSQDIAEWYLQVARDAEKNLAPGSFEILEHKADVKIMGSTVYEDYSRAVDNSLKITKGFAIGSFVFFIATLFL
jgi:putative membrane protein